MLFLRNSQICIFSGFLAVLVFYVSHLHAAPLEGGFAAAPSPLASPEEKAAAFREARLKVIAAAEKYEHTPYLYGGLDRSGLDCSGLVYLSFHDALGISVPRNTVSLYSWVEKIQIENAQPGDLLFFKTTDNGDVSHVGIFVGDGRFIHAASEGLVTGVIYSSLNERYWASAYIGAGRVLPEVNMESINNNNGASLAQKQKRDNKNSKILIGFAAAPTWGIFFTDSGVIRGVAGQFRLGVVNPLGLKMILGIELRPEWDRTLGVFRLPITLSWGINDKFRIFGGPAFSFGNAALNVSGESRRYTSGARWFGAAGITIAPFAFTIAGSELAPYGELAWQSYFSNADKNLRADFAASFRFSTGLRYTWKP